MIDKKESQAVKILKAAGFKVKVQSLPHPTLDRVFSQSPLGGTAPYGSTVTITVV